MSAAVSSDAIVKQILIRAPRARVWRALTDSGEFGEWFGVRFSAPFAAGARMRGPITHKGYDHLTMDFTIEGIEPERRFSWRWHPNAIDPARNYTDEPTTLVTFELAEVPEGTLLTVTETGFDRIPADRRAEAYRGNEGGWAYQVDSINRHVSANA
jgi:uncharacterized protein YndB with AHSA1/START domain